MPLPVVLKGGGKFLVWRILTALLLEIRCAVWRSFQPAYRRMKYSIADVTVSCQHLGRDVARKRLDR